MPLRLFSLFVLILLAAGCSAPSARPSLQRSLKAATSRATGCPQAEISISGHRPRLKSWTATGCHRTYSCVGISLDVELADCNSNTVAKLPR